MITRNNLNSLPKQMLAFLLAAFSNASLAATLIVGVDPSLEPPSPQFISDISEVQAKRFGKVKYRKVEPKDPHDIWRELMEIASMESGLALTYEKSSGLLDFELKLANGHYDIAYMSPIQFVNLNKRGIYKALAKRKSQPSKGLIVARKARPLDTLRDLEGKVVAFPGLLSFSNSIVPRISLERLDINVLPHFTASTESAFQLVIDDRVLGAAGSHTALAALAPKEREKLYIVWDTPAYSPHSFARHARVPFYTQIRLQKALVGLIKTARGKTLLPLIHINNGFETAKDSDWSDALQIDVDTINNKKAYSLPEHLEKSSATRNIE